MAYYILVFIGIIITLGITNIFLFWKVDKMRTCLCLQNEYSKNIKRRCMPIEMMIPIETNNENGTYCHSETKIILPIETFRK